MTRDELTQETFAAHIAFKGGSWIHSGLARAEAVSEPAWLEIQRLQDLVTELEYAAKGFP